MFSVVLLLDKPFNIIGTIITKPFAIYAPFPIQNETVVISPFVINFAGIVFSRKLSSTHGSTRSVFVVDLSLLLKMTALLSNELAKVFRVAVARNNIITFVNEALFDSTRQLTLYYVNGPGGRCNGVVYWRARGGVIDAKMKPTFVVS
ncbi:hypothetical protein GQ600_1011 [Phytophthora cactorum]|nr:hypothetical protein GQ600_1011 [Phytophthora cactorum]